MGHWQTCNIGIAIGKRKETNRNETRDETHECDKQLNYDWMMLISIAIYDSVTVPVSCPTFWVGQPWTKRRRRAEGGEMEDVVARRSVELESLGVKLSHSRQI